VNFFKGMEEVGKTLAKGIESTVKERSRETFGPGRYPQPLSCPPGTWPFFYSKQEGDQEPKPIWNVKIPLQFFMAFRGLLVTESSNSSETLHPLILSKSTRN
jgi:hypothetical protein